MPYIGEIRLFAGNFPPRGWALCNGQQLTTSEFPEAFGALGVSFGGDGIETFALPDLRGRVPVHIDGTIALGQEGGSELATLSNDDMPGHSHAFVVSRSQAVDVSPVGRVFATEASNAGSVAGGGQAVLARTLPAGAGNAHDNMQPYAGLSFIIALEGESAGESGVQT